MRSTRFRSESQRPSMQTAQKLGVVVTRMRQSSFVGRYDVSFFSENLCVVGVRAPREWWSVYVRGENTVVAWQSGESVRQCVSISIRPDGSKAEGSHSWSLPNSRISTLHNCAIPSL